MAIRPVLKYPHINLRELCQPVEDFTLPEIQQDIYDLIETLYDHTGAIGLSAPQIGSQWRIMVIDMAAKTTREQLKVMINPEVVQDSRRKMVREGCLSFPDYLANVRRATKLTVRYRNAEGVVCEDEVRDLEAVAIQHEIDHLDGILMIDRVHSLKTDVIRRVAQEMAQHNTADKVLSDDELAKLSAEVTS